MSNSLVSVIIPTYNRMATLPRAINSVLQQNYTNLELIIVDDGSNDGTDKYIEQLNDNRLKYIRLEKNLGPAGARNAGVNAAKGKYIAFQDSDDEWDENKLAIQMEVLKNSPDCDLVYCAMKQVDEDNIVVDIIPSKKLSEEFTKGNIYEFLLSYCLISTQTILIKKSIFQNLGGFDENLKALEDYDFSLKYAKEYIVEFVDKVLVTQYLSKNSVNQNGKNKILAEFEIFRKRINDFRKYEKILPYFEIMRSEAEKYNCLNFLQKELLKRKGYFTENEWEKIYNICFHEQRLFYSQNRKYIGAGYIFTLIQQLYNMKNVIDMLPLITAIMNFLSKLEFNLHIERQMKMINENSNFESVYGLIQRLEQELKEKMFTCCVCRNRVIYNPMPDYYDKKRRKYSFPYWNKTFQLESKENYFCPICRSTDRARLIIQFLSFLKDELGNNLKVLQIAPDDVIERYLKARDDIEYESTDLFMDKVTFTADIQDLSMVENQTYDIVICSHVLEHVHNDRVAMKELYRILKQDGMCIILVPLIVGLDATDEQWGCAPEENWKRFGQDDHCRLYAKADFVDRLEVVGFMVNELGEEWFGSEFFKECGFDKNSFLYVATKGIRL